MFHILGFLFIIIIAILLIGLSIVGTVIRSIFGFGGRHSSKSHQDNPSDFSQKKTKPEDDTTYSKRKKLFSEDEGEYVDFEEIKD